MSARAMLFPVLAAILAVGCSSEDQLRRVEQEVGDLKLEVFKLRQQVEDGNKLAATEHKSAEEAREQDRRFQADLQENLRQLKDTTRVQLLQSIRDVANGHASIHPSIAMKVIHEFDHPSEGALTNQTLTRRELEALRLIARGLSNQEIAATLVVHERTIAKYVSSILNKLHVSNRPQAALYAIREGLAVPGTD